MSQANVPGAPQGNNGPTGSAGSSDSSKGNSGSHKYRYISKKGSGAFSDVIKAECVKNNNLVAIKRMKAVFKSVEQITGLREVQALRKLSDHPNIIKLLEILYDRNSGRLALVFELMDMNLFELIKGRRVHLPEARIKMYMYQMLLALEASHKMGIFHRDIKPENVLISENVLKLGDFGSCRGIFTQQPFTEYISTRWYRPPECLLTDGFYSVEMDIFATGCVMFEVYALFPLFPGKDELDQINKIHAILGTPQRELLAKIRKGTKNNPIKCDFPPQQGTGFARLIPHASKEAIDLIDRMIQYDPKRRITASEALRHPYFNNVALVDTSSNQIVGYLNQKDGTIRPVNNGNQTDSADSANPGSAKGYAISSGSNKRIDVEAAPSVLHQANKQQNSIIGSTNIHDSQRQYHTDAAGNDELSTSSKLYSDPNGSSNSSMKALPVDQESLQKQQMYGARPSKTPPNAKRVTNQNIKQMLYKYQADGSSLPTGSVGNSTGQLGPANGNISNSNNISVPSNSNNNSNSSTNINNTYQKQFGIGKFGYSNNTKISESNASMLHVNQTVVEKISRESSTANVSISRTELGMTLPNVNGQPRHDNFQHNMAGPNQLQSPTNLNSSPMILPMLNNINSSQDMLNSIQQNNNTNSSSNVNPMVQVQKRQQNHKINNGITTQRNIFANPGMQGTNHAQNYNISTNNGTTSNSMANQQGLANQPIKGGIQYNQYMVSTKLKKNSTGQSATGNTQNQMYVNYSNQPIPVHQRIGMSVKYNQPGQAGSMYGNTKNLYKNTTGGSKAKLPNIY